MSDTAHRLATFADMATLEAEGRCIELVGGGIVDKASPSAAHADAQGALAALLRPRFHRQDGDEPPGGWWILPEVDIAFGLHDVLRPDVAGWRRARVPVRPSSYPVDVSPDWVCEVLSPSTAHRDLGVKREIYHRHEVAHYWVVDVEKQILLVYRREPAGYTLVLSAGPGERVRAEPFDACSLDMDELFGIEPGA